MERQSRRERVRASKRRSDHQIHLAWERLSLSRTYCIYLWEPSVSPHKLDLFSALESSARVRDAKYIAQQSLAQDRVDQGWTISRGSTDQVIVGPMANEVIEIIDASPQDAIHIFSGIHWVPCIVDGLKAVISRKRRFGLMSEPRVLEGVKGWVRLAHSWLTEREIRASADFVLAIGRNGPPWFKAAGYKPEKTFPFAYFVPGMPEGLVAATRMTSDPVKVTWLGRLTKEKGIDDFLAALPLVRNRISVRVAGIGSEAQRVHEYAAASSGSFGYLGTVPMAFVPALLNDTDILVLASRTSDDGWGAVVSEALLAGAAVVATERVGASVCLNDDDRGVIVEANAPAQLAAAIDKLVNQDCLTPQQRSRRSAWAQKSLTGAAGAAYMLSILDFVYRNGGRPNPFYEMKLDGKSRCAASD